jgi:hypothetical protein
VQSRRELIQQRTRATEECEAAFHFEQQLVPRLEAHQWCKSLTPGGQTHQPFTLLPGIARARFEL